MMLRPLLTVPLLAVSLVAQSTLLVGPGRPFADIQAAVAAASPGDRVLVAAGSYPGFTLDKGLLLRADPVGAAVSVTTANGAVQCRVPQGQSAVVAGIVSTAAIWIDRPTGSTSAGIVSLVEITANAGVRVVDAHLTVRGCTIRNFGPGLDVFGDSTVSATQSAITAAFQSFIPFVDGMRVSGTSSVHCSGCTVTGGTAGFHGVTAMGNGATFSGAASGWFVDSTLQAYVNHVPGFAPVGIANQSSQAVTVERCQLLDSFGMPGAFTGNVVSGFVLGLSSTTPLARGGTVVLSYATRPGMPVIAHAAFGLSTSIVHPLLAQPDFGFATNSVHFHTTFAGSSGVATVAVPLPNAPWLQDVQLWFGGWSELGLPVQLAPVLGGPIR